MNKAIEQILNATVNVKLWNYANLHYTQQQMEAEAARKMGEDIKTQIKTPKPMHKQIRYPILGSNFDVKTLKEYNFFLCIGYFVVHKNMGAIFFHYAILFAKR